MKQTFTKYLSRFVYRTTKITLLTFILISMTVAGFAQVIIGTGTANTQRMPFMYWYGYGRDASIYTSAEMGTTTSGETITSLAWNSSIASTTVAPTVIYVKAVGSTATVSSTATWADNIAGATQVYSGTPANWVIGWNTIDITDFPIAAGQNLMVLVECNAGGSGTGGQFATAFYYTAGPTDCHAHWQKDTDPPTGSPSASTSGSVNTSRPNITINATPAGCTAPTVTYTTVSDCANNQFSVNVNITNMGNATSIGISDGTNTYGPATATGTFTAGPYTSGTVKTFTLTHNVNALCNLTSAPQTFNCPPLNDEAINAATLSLNADLACGLTTNGSTIASTQSTDAAPSCSATGINDDVWYKFTATSSAHQFQFSNVTTGTMAVALYTGTPGALVGTTDCGSGSTVNFTDLVPGTLYYARVFTTAAATTTTTNFTVCLGTIPNMSYVSSNTTQISTGVNAGTTNQQIIRMDVVVNGIPNGLNLTQFDFNTTGTTNVADIVNAKVYYTGTSSTFATTTQFGTTTVSPNGNFTVTGSQALTGGTANTTNYFWLAYDVNCSATGANVLDAQCTAITVGTVQTPTATNPSGTRAITAASFTATTVQPSTAITQTGFVNQQVLRVAFTGCASSPVTAITFNTTGTTNVADIVNAKVYFTTSTTFATTTQFGSTVASPNGAFTVNGSQPLGGTTGYFWLTYDIASNATADDLVDASCVSGIVNGITATPSTANPTGTRTIKVTPVNDECINAIAFPTIPTDGTCVSVTADCTYGSQSLAGCAGTADDDLWYSFVCPAGQTSLLFANTTVTGSSDRVIQFFSGTCGNLTSLLCSDPEAGIVSGLTPGNTYYFRVYSYSSATATSVSVCLKTPQMAFVSSTTEQVTGTLSQGSVDQGIIRVNVVTSGSLNPLSLTQLNFNTTGTTNVADITNAKVYYTGTSTTFSTATPFGSVTVAPNGSFSVTGSQVLAGSNTGNSNNYFFLTYDVPCGATVTNVMDAQCTNLTVGGVPRVPSETNPTGTRAIVAATYTATTNQPLTSNVPIGGTYQQVLRVDLTGCSSSTVSSITFSTTGSTSAANIANAKVFYTPTTTFAATTQFGSTVVSPSGNFTVTGSQLLGAATAYFWLVYDISPTAVASNVVDASCVSAIVAGNTATPSTANPSGTRTIVTPAINDEAPGAVSLTVGAGCTTNPYDNTNAFQSISEPFTSCKGSAGYATTWFKFVAPASGRVKVSCDGGGTLADSRMALYSVTDASNYSTFTILACDDDNGVTTAARSLFYAAGLIPGNTYYVSVDLYSSTTTKGTFCVTVDDISASMIATTAGDCVADQASVAAYNSNYTGWISLVDANGNLNANVRQLSGTATGFSSSRTIKSGTARTDAAGLAYLNRNFLISGTDATSADVQLFFTDAEVSNLGASLGSLNVSRVPGSTCNANFAGTATVLTQTGSGSANGVSHIQFNTPGFSNFYVMAGFTPLPLKLTSFDGQNRGAANILNWTTASDKNASHFDVMRSNDGNKFEVLGRVNAKENVAGSKYEFMDSNPFDGRNFYRLNMVDMNGKSVYSDVVVLSVRSSAGLSLTASPNPVNQTLNISINGKIDGKAMVQIVDITGKTVQKIQVSSNNTSIDMSALSAGTYIIRYNDNSNSSVIKVTKN